MRPSRAEREQPERGPEAWPASASAPSPRRSIAPPSTRLSALIRSARRWLWPRRSLRQPASAAVRCSSCGACSPPAPARTAPWCAPAGVDQLAADVSWWSTCAPAGRRQDVSPRRAARVVAAISARTRPRRASGAAHRRPPVGAGRGRGRPCEGEEPEEQIAHLAPPAAPPSDGRAGGWARGYGQPTTRRRLPADTVPPRIPAEDRRPANTLAVLAPVLAFLARPPGWWTASAPGGSSAAPARRASARSARAHHHRHASGWVVDRRAAAICVVAGSMLANGSDLPLIPRAG